MKRAFTLIELLIVMAIIGVMAGALAAGLRGGDRTLALQSAQGTLAGLINAARGQSALSGRNAALLLHADAADSTRYLRAFAVTVLEPDGITWASEDWIMLPAGIAVLPPVVPATLLSEPIGAWDGLRSSAFNPATQVHGGAASHLLSFTPRGTISGLGGNIVLTPATAQPPDAAFPLRFDNPEAVRGVSVSAYGIATLIHDRSGF